MPFPQQTSVPQRNLRKAMLAVALGFRAEDVAAVCADIAAEICVRRAKSHDDAHDRMFDCFMTANEKICQSFCEQE